MTALTRSPSPFSVGVLANRALRGGDAPRAAGGARGRCRPAGSRRRRCRASRGAPGAAPPAPAPIRRCGAGGGPRRPDCRRARRAPAGGPPWRWRGRRRRGPRAPRRAPGPRHRAVRRGSAPRWRATPSTIAITTQRDRRADHRRQPAIEHDRSPSRGRGSGSRRVRGRRRGAGRDCVRRGAVRAAASAAAYSGAGQIVPAHDRGRGVDHRRLGRARRASVRAARQGRPGRGRRRSRCGRRRAGRGHGRRRLGAHAALGRRVQRRRHLGRRLGAILLALGQRLHHHRLQRRRDARRGSQRADRRRRRLAVHEDQLADLLRLERLAPGQQLEQQHADRVEIAARVDGARGAGLLRATCSSACRPPCRRSSPARRAAWPGRNPGCAGDRPARPRR